LTLPGDRNGSESSSLAFRSQGAHEGSALISPQAKSRTRRIEAHARGTDLRAALNNRIVKIWKHTMMPTIYVSVGRRGIVLAYKTGMKAIEAHFYKANVGDAP